MPLEERRRRNDRAEWGNTTVPRRGEAVETKLLRIAEKARREGKFQFTSLFHLMDRELLRGCFVRLRKEAAAGIDGVTKAMYGEELEERLTELVERLQRMARIDLLILDDWLMQPLTCLLHSKGGFSLFPPSLENSSLALLALGVSHSFHRLYDDHIT